MDANYQLPDNKYGLNKYDYEYITMMYHTLKRRMDNQAGKDELINEYCDKMAYGFKCVDENWKEPKEIK